MTSKIMDYEEAVNQIFHFYDENNNNYLEIREIVALLKDGAYVLGIENVSTNDISSFIKLVDKNKDGKISRKELLTFIRYFSEVVQGETYS
jgi:Ca2+-binding EF-hand superfamily protein